MYFCFINPALCTYGQSPRFYLKKFSKIVVLRFQNPLILLEFKNNAKHSKFLYSIQHKASFMLIKPALYTCTVLNKASFIKNKGCFMKYNFFRHTKFIRKTFEIYINRRSYGARNCSNAKINAA